MVSLSRRWRLITLTLTSIILLSIIPSAQATQAAQPRTSVDLKALLKNLYDAVKTTPTLASIDAQAPVFGLKTGRQLPDPHPSLMPPARNPLLPANLPQQLGAAPYKPAIGIHLASDWSLPYIFNNGNSATDVGLAESGAGYWSAANAGVGSWCPGCLNPNYYSMSPQTIGSAFNDSFNAYNAGLNLQNTIVNGTFNEFAYQANPPYQWNAGFQNIDYAGAAFASQVNDPTLLAVLGYDSSSAYNFGSQFLLNSNNLLYSPWTETNYSYGSGFTASTQSIGIAGGTAFAKLTNRYDQIASDQLDVYYRDSQLSSMRHDSNSVLIALLYRDPLYDYYSEAYDQVIQQVLQQTRDYNLLISYGQEIASWTSAPADAATLQRRYFIRLVYVYLQSLVSNEAVAIINSDPQLATWVSQTASYLADLRTYLWSQPAAANWFQNWSASWQVNYNDALSQSGTIDAGLQILQDFPTYATYNQLDREVVDQLMPAFANHPAVQQVNALAQTVLSDPQTESMVTSTYQAYTGRVDQALSGTQYISELERYYDQLNGLVANDSLYQLMSTVQSAVLTQLETLRQQVATRVDQCYQYYGNSCDPYSYAPVVNLLNQQQTFDTLTNVGQFYEVVNLYWYQFYTKQTNYLQLEQQSANRMQATLSPILGTIEQARNQFTQDVNNIPTISQLKEARLQLTDVLRGRRTQLNVSGLTAPASADSAPAAGYPYAQLDHDLSIMEHLSHQLRFPYQVSLPLTRR
jgi:hypothetical protein